MSRRRKVHAVRDGDRSDAVRNGVTSVWSACGLVLILLGDLIPGSDGVSCVPCLKRTARERGVHEGPCARCGWAEWWLQHVCTATGRREIGWDDRKDPKAVRWNAPSTVGAALRLALSDVDLRCEHGDRPLAHSETVTLEGQDVRLGVCGDCAFALETFQDIVLANGTVIGW